MPRHTRRTDDSLRHSRLHSRHQRQRWADKRFAEAKARLAHHISPGVHPESVRRRLGEGHQAWPAEVGYAWPFALSANQLSRNVHTVCSCMSCTWQEPVVRGDWRQDEERGWGEEWDQRA